MAQNTLLVVVLLGVVIAGLVLAWYMGRRSGRAGKPVGTEEMSGRFSAPKGVVSMTFVELSAEEQAVLANYVKMARAWCGEQARANNHAAALNDGYGPVQTILAKLAGGDAITDGSGLAGAMSLTKDEVVSLTAHMQGVLTNYNTAGHRQMWAKAAGPGNLIG